MRYVAAYMLAHMGGNHHISVDDLEEIITSVGIDFDAEQAKHVISQLQGKDLDELIAAGSEKLSSVPSGGGAAVAAAGGGAVTGAETAEEEKEEEKKEEEKSESEESDDDMGFGLFD